MSGLSEMTGNDGDLEIDFSGNISSEAEEETLSDPYNDDETRSLSSSTSSPPPTRSSFAKDTKRLNLDLSRHRAMLVDSQKLNQTIKRCLDTTESLISLGEKALDYRIDVSSIENLPPSPRKAGGRVLERDDEDDDFGQRGQGLLSPAIISPETGNPWDSLNLTNTPPQHEEADPDADDPDPEWDIHDIGTAISSPLASPSPVTSHSHHHPTFPSEAEMSPGSSAALKTGWDAIKQDVKTPDGLRAAAPLGLGNYLQSLGWSPGSAAG